MATYRVPAWIGLAVALAAGCTIKKSVEPIPQPLDPTLCVEENVRVRSTDFLQTLCEELERHGVRTWVYQTQRPADCRYHVTYAARWRRGLVSDLRYADIQVFQDERRIGHAVYDAGGAVANPRRFASMRSKLRPLIDELMRTARPSTP